jgi:hypothetical protein
MSETVIVALITTAGSVLVAITALLLNYRGFASLDARMLALETRLERDIKDLTGAVNELDKRLTRVEIKLGIQP